METNTDSDAHDENQKKFQLNITKRSIVIFHCEFSSERGPSLLVTFLNIKILKNLKFN